MAQQHRRPTLTLITGSRDSGEASSSSHSYDGLICAGLEQVLGEAMADIFDVDLAHFVGELRNGYRDVLIDVVEDVLKSMPDCGPVTFEGKGTFGLDWNSPPMVQLEFTWRGPFYSVIFYMTREGSRRFCALESIEPEPGYDMERVVAHLLRDLWHRLGQDGPAIF